MASSRGLVGEGGLYFGTAEPQTKLAWPARLVV